MSSEEITSVKILMLGEAYVGKTCLIRRYIENVFTSSYKNTIGIDFFSKTLTINNKEINLKIWDTAGEERFRNLTNQYYNRTDGIILVFDLTNINTMYKIQYWIDQINEKINRNDISLVLIGNKSDLERQISYENCEKFSEDLNIKYFESSALSGENVNEFFDYLVNEIINKKNIMEKNDDQKVSIISNNYKKKKKKLVLVEYFLDFFF